MYIWLFFAALFAALQAVAVSQDLRQLEYVAKPAVMLCLFLWLYISTGLQGHPLWFGVGILFSLVGDILLMTAFERWFLPGLIAFLLAHCAYITGFREQLASTSSWTFILLFFIVINAGRLMRRILPEMRARGQNQLVFPVLVYGTVISFMLYMAMSTLYDPAWQASSALLVSLGAFLFWVSDLILAWNKFVSPIQNGRLFNIITYHLGQICLIAGVITQFG